MSPKAYIHSICAAVAFAGAFGFTAHAAEPYYELPADYSVCSDNSYQRAVDNGVKLGVAAAMPWSGIDPATGKPTGIDVEMHAEVLTVRRNTCHGSTAMRSARWSHSSARSIRATS
jgi:hypothetical protein